MGKNISLTLIRSDSLDDWFKEISTKISLLKKD